MRFETQDYKKLLKGLVRNPVFALQELEERLKKEAYEAYLKENKLDVVREPETDTKEPKVVVREPETKVKKLKRVLPSHLTRYQLVQIYKDLQSYVSGSIKRPTEKNFLEVFLAGKHPSGIRPRLLTNKLKTETWRRKDKKANLWWILIKRAVFIENGKLFVRYNPKKTAVETAANLRDLPSFSLSVYEKPYLQHILDVNEKFLKKK